VSNAEGNWGWHAWCRGGARSRNDPGAGCVVSRIDGRDKSPSMGTWTHSEAGIVFLRIEYQFSAGALVRTVNVLATAKVDGDSMSGTFTGLVGGSFFRSGSFTATHLPAKGP
jgi:hypothetical protein